MSWPAVIGEYRGGSLPLPCFDWPQALPVTQTDSKEGSGSFVALGSGTQSKEKTGRK
jgi:hypothetical protein